MSWKYLSKLLWPGKPKEATRNTITADPDADQKDIAQKIHPKKPHPEPVLSAKKKIEGWQTQFIDIPENAQPVQVTIGFDFGTAFTKVIIDGAGRKYGVPLNENKEGTDKYLLPTILYEDSVGNPTIIQPEKILPSHANLKMRILDDDLDASTRDHIITYIALVLQKSRNWLMTEKQTVFGANHLKWAINIGLPTDKHGNENLKQLYRNLIQEAWYSSTDPHLGNKDAGRPYNADNTERELDSDFIEAFPEFSAQIQGYISSPQRKSGIHTLIDVGAGTIDATVFIVHSDADGQNIHPILAGSVKKLGTTYLAKHRCEKLGNPNNWKLNPQDLFPSDEEFLRNLETTKEKMENVDKFFKKEIINQINSQLEYAYNEMTIPISWDSVPLSLCGGGARVKFYKKCYLKEILNVLQNTSHGRSLEEFYLPPIISLDAPDLPEKDNDRFSVAYGLSFDALAIGKITRPDPIPLQTESGTPKGSKCPSCNGTGGPYHNCPECGGSGFL